MSQVVLDITMSLDGFVTAPNDGPGRGLGDDGEFFGTRLQLERARVLDSPFATHIKFRVLK